jgi:hypothetical protein
VRGHFTIQDRIRRVTRKIERAAADETTDSSPHLGLSARIQIPLPHAGMPALAEIAADVETAATSSTTKANPTQVLAGISEVMRVFEPERMPTPVLIIDDADKWGSSPDAEEIEPRAQALSATAPQPLLAADFHLIVAVQDHWRALPAYENLDKRLAQTITIPEFIPDATDALRQIITTVALNERGELTSTGPTALPRRFEACQLVAPPTAARPAALDPMEAGRPGV